MWCLTKSLTFLLSLVLFIQRLYNILASPSLLLLFPFKHMKGLWGVAENENLRLFDYSGQDWSYRGIKSSFATQFSLTCLCRGFWIQLRILMWQIRLKEMKRCLFGPVWHWKAKKTCKHWITLCITHDFLWHFSSWAWCQLCEHYTCSGLVL